MTRGARPHVTFDPRHILCVIAGLVPAIHVFFLLQGRKDVDARDKRGHDEEGITLLSKVIEL